MRWIPTLLILSSSVAAVPHLNVIAGAIVEDAGTLFPITEVLEINIDCTTMNQIPSTLKTVLKNLQIVREAIGAQDDLNRWQKGALMQVVMATESVLQPLTEPPRQTRARRGLLDIVGKAGQWLFGLATEDGVNKQIQDHVGAVVSRVDTTILELHIVTAKVGELVNTTDQLAVDVAALEVVAKAEQRFSLLLALITAYLSNVKLYSHQVEVLQGDLVMAGYGKVTPTLIPPRHLLELTKNLIANTNYEPLFGPSNIVTFYSQLRSIYTQKGLAVIVPLKPQQHYTLTIIHSFPYKTQQGTFMMSPTSKIILKDSSSQVTTSIEQDRLMDCDQPTQKTYACLNFPIFQKSYWEENCTRAVITGLNVTTHCTYDEVDTKDTTPYILTLPQLTAIYFRQKQQVTITCNKTEKTSTVQGPIFLPAPCRLDSHRLTVRPTHRLHTSYTPTLIDLTLGNLTGPPSHPTDQPHRIRPLPISDTEMQLRIPSPHATFGYPVVLSTASVVLVLIAFLIYRKTVSDKIHERGTRVNLPSAPQTE